MPFLFTPLLAQSSSEFLLGAAVAAALLVGGLALGIWLARRMFVAPPVKAETQDLLQLLSGLSRWTNGFATDVSQMREVMDVASQQMKNLNASPHQPPGTANKLLEQVAVANEVLQKRITDAETTLKQQANQITSYMNEARTDSLTGIPNRRAFDDCAFGSEISFEKSYRAGQAFLLRLCRTHNHFVRMNAI